MNEIETMAQLKERVSSVIDKICEDREKHGFLEKGMTNRYIETWAKLCDPMPPGFALALTRNLKETLAALGMADKDMPDNAEAYVCWPVSSPNDQPGSLQYTFEYELIDKVNNHETKDDVS